ncbi:7TM diverse intracellular signaling domain-containing protein [Shewanella pealeana]|uniref:Periplasmic/7TM domain sensor diguanylate cyclase n=1 Tax=Shewanella pealeana (strain ATCC 700345 / ANG-SQ1) TaxID=398579 RepID=A8H6U1_SHEPA|nr:7TM diverse intracellular signaling domain-containing protein [Shewanella pealeana]ABV88278.1 periplasmic/7TM domain sensor diguanylate cyclase [Shewanella pealeana ATCC 700345]
MLIKIIMRLLLLLSVFVYCDVSYARQAAVMEKTFIFSAEAEDEVPKDFLKTISWMEDKKELNRVSLSGGNYWMVSAVQVNNYNKHWTVNVKNSIIESVDYWLIGEDGSTQYFHSGYYAPYEFLFDYARSVEMSIGVNYWFITRVNSRYFSSQPKLQVEEYKEHKRQSDIYALFIILCIGGLIFITLYNGIIYVSIRDKAFLYYACYVLCYLTGWALTFHLPAHLFDFHNLELHHLFFIGLPIFNILFYIHFLQLPELSPKLYRLSLGLLWLCIIALPTSMYLVSYTAIIASVLIMLWIGLAMFCGNVCLLKGFHPARYFLLAFTCLLLPAVLILPGNMGLTPDFFDNAELATLIGGAADALLLSFALAYKIRLLSEEKERHIEILEVARKNARTDKLTGLPNRFAFDESMLKGLPFGAQASRQLCLTLVSLEGLPLLTRKLGHNEVDKVICSVAESLRQVYEYVDTSSDTHSNSMSELTNTYRIADNSFVVVCEADISHKIQQQVSRLQSGYLIDHYSDVSIHFGASFNRDVNDSGQWLRQSEHDLYKNQSVKRRERYVQSLSHI